MTMSLNNQNLHSYDTFWNLGIDIILDSISAEAAFKAIANKTEGFNLKLYKDVAACATDGASVMVKLWS